MALDDGSRTVVARRREEVLRLREAGMSWPQIAEEIQRRRGDGDKGAAYTAKHAQMDGRRALRAAQESLAAFTEYHLVLELERLDRLTRALETLLAQARQAGDRWQALRAVRELVTVSKQRDRLLGLSGVSAEARRQPDVTATEGNNVASIVDAAARRRAARRASAR